MCLKFLFLFFNTADFSIKISVRWLKKSTQKSLVLTEFKNLIYFKCYKCCIVSARQTITKMYLVIIVQLEGEWRLSSRSKRSANRFQFTIFHLYTFKPTSFGSYLDFRAPLCHRCLHWSPLTMPTQYRTQLSFWQKI